MNNQEAEFLARYYEGKLNNSGGLVIQGTRMQGSCEFEPCVALLTPQYAIQGRVVINLQGRESWRKLPAEYYAEKEYSGIMTEEEAIVIANIFGGTAHHSGGGFWVVELTNVHGEFVVIDNHAICAYADEDAFYSGDHSVRTVCFV